MKKHNKFIDWLLRPHGAWLILLYCVTIASVIGAILTMTVGDASDSRLIVSYALYGVAAVTLGYSVYTLVRIVPALKRNVKERLQKNEFTGKLLAHYGFRTIVFSILSLIVSAAYAVYNGVIAALSSSTFYGALASYYLLLVLLRGSVLFYHRQKKKTAATEEEHAEDKKTRALKVYGFCGSILIVLPFCLSFAVMEIVGADKAFEHAGYMIYVAAAYTFYKVIMSCVNLSKARKNEDMTIRAVRNINLADALVSVLALQTAMFRSFSSGINNGVFNAVTGAAVCALTAALGIYMVINVCRKLRRLREVKEDTQK